MKIATQRELLEKNGFAMPKTSGKSMRPLIWERSHRVAVVPIKGEPALDDILFFEFRRPDGTTKNVIHRLVEIRREDGQPLYITRGDNCVASEFIRREDIIGRVAEIHRVGGWRPWHAIPIKRIKTDSASYRAYSRLWAATWPLRRIAYILRNKLSRNP